MYNTLYTGDKSFNIYHDSASDVYVIEIFEYTLLKRLETSVEITDVNVYFRECKKRYVTAHSS